MADKNIQIKQRNATNDDWDNVYPKTKAEIVETDANNRFVSEEDIDNWNNKQDVIQVVEEVPTTDTIENQLIFVQI